MHHAGGIIVVVVLAAVVLIVALSLGRSIRRASRMNLGSPGYEPADPGAERRDDG
jgi:hypothetical protein